MPQQYDRQFLLVRDVPQVTVFVHGHRNLAIDSIRRSRPDLEQENSHWSDQSTVGSQRTENLVRFCARSHKHDASVRSWQV